MAKNICKGNSKPQKMATGKSDELLQRTFEEYLALPQNIEEDV